MNKYSLRAKEKGKEEERGSIWESKLVITEIKGGWGGSEGKDLSHIEGWGIEWASVQ